MTQLSTSSSEGPLLLLVLGRGAVRSFVEETLASLGFEWLSARGSGEALELLTKPEAGVILATSASAHALFEDDWPSALRQRPSLPILFCASEEIPCDVADNFAMAYDWVRWPSENSYFPYALDSALDAARGPGRQMAGAHERRLIGYGARMKSLLQSLERASHSSAGLLVCGEPGTGKSLTASAVHSASRRRDRFLVVVNGAHPPAILERELSGPPGYPALSRLEKAAHGTLFLDHVDRMSLDAQDSVVQWLRQCEGAAVEEAPLSARPRLLAAACRPLEQAVSDRLFREELLRAVAAIRVDLPPLRERIEDIPYLAVHFLERDAAEKNIPTKTLSPVVLRAFEYYPWPQNLRELATVLRRACAFGTESVLQLGDLPSDFLSAIGPSLLGSPAPRELGTKNGAELPDLSRLSRTLFEWARKDARLRLIPAMERELIIHALAETKGNQVQAARLLGITRATLRKRLHRFNIQRDVYIH